MGNVVDILHERGFIEQTTHDKELHQYFETETVTCYIGFDPTASSLHVGSLIPIMALAHMQRHGHRPIALVGGGTGLVGDPSGRTEMRQLLTLDMVAENARCIKNQLSHFIDFSGDKAMILNNAEWLTMLGYIPFLRDIGRHFSVNRMIKAESCKVRLNSDEGLSFIEFNYMVLQAYDFLELFNKHHCRLQMGGSDQWGNIVAGIDLIRRMHQEVAFGITFPLITTSNGAKMGKTAKGAVWLDAGRTSPYNYYQFWVNTDDRDVARFLALFTFIPMSEIREVEKLEGANLNSAKAILAFEVTRLAHGNTEALKAHDSSMSMFGNRIIPEEIIPSSSVLRHAAASNDGSVPLIYVSTDDLEKGISAFKLFFMTGLTKSGGASRRLIEQGGAYINGERVSSYDFLVTDKDLKDGEIILRSGKKRFYRVKAN